ncbi:MAG: non-heme iron oxygenase ferredoxin subunit [Acidimicrobiia bacterium]|nr:non-heme iron oxygenase ferredoxin subunit [Acidimicrobiia bacterium]NNL27545.1 non-heme iron oxygenase ferredoxin subunit [Acidimicrobiia bacterium]
MSERIDAGSVADYENEVGKRFEQFGHRIAVFKIGDTFYALGDRCSHAEASLSEGEIWDGAVECPRHGSAFDLETGQPNALPATKPVPSYAVIVEDGNVYLEVEPREEEE